MSLILWLLILLEWFLALIVFCMGIIAIYFAFNSSFMCNAPPVHVTMIARAKIHAVAMGGVTAIIVRQMGCNPRAFYGLAPLFCPWNCCLGKCRVR